MSNKNYTLEAVVDSVEAAVAAESAGADRLELCIGLELGGLTPSVGLTELVVEAVTVPVFVLLRPRGGDFCYSEQEWATLLQDAERLRDVGVHGVVAGCLTAGLQLDVPKMEALLVATKLPVTFHRAFDRCADPRRLLADLVHLGVQRILTSGQAASALEGAALLAELRQEFGDEIILMPGGGISPDNVREVAARTGAAELHFSAIKLHDEQAAKESPALGKGRKQSFHFIPDPDKVQAIRAALAQGDA